MAASLLAGPAVHAAADLPNKNALKGEKVQLVNFNKGYQEEETNDSFSQANQVAPNMLVEGNFTDKDKDYYKIEIKGDETVEFHLMIFTMDDFETGMELNLNL